MLDIDDVAAGRSDELRDGRQDPRTVGHLDVQTHDTTRPGECPQQDRRQHARVDVAAAEHHTDPLGVEELRMLQHRREAGGTRTLEHGLLDLERERDRFLDALLGHDEQVVHELARRCHASTPPAP